MSKGDSVQGGQCPRGIVSGGDSVRGEIVSGGDSVRGRIVSRGDSVRGGQSPGETVSRGDRVQGGQCPGRTLVRVDSGRGWIVSICFGGDSGQGRQWFRGDNVLEPFQ